MVRILHPPTSIIVTRSTQRKVCGICFNVDVTILALLISVQCQNKLLLTFLKKEAAFLWKENSQAKFAVPVPELFPMMMVKLISFFNYYTGIFNFEQCHFLNYIFRCHLYNRLDYHLWMCTFVS